MNIEILNAVQKMLKDTSVAEFQLQKADVTIKIKTGGNYTPVAESVPDEATAEVAEEKVVKVIKAMDVGIFSTGKSGAKVGLAVKKNQIVGEIISMGISHAVKSNVEGIITEQKVKSKEPVEYGEVIFEVEES